MQKTVGALFLFFWGICFAEQISSDRQLIQEFARLVNEHRKSVGCAALKWDSKIAAFAQAHSIDMAGQGPAYLSHESSTGKSFSERVIASGIPWSRAGENVAITSNRDPRHLLELFLSSKEHRENLEKCSFTHHGVGLKKYKWTHTFGNFTPARTLSSAE
jgi:uncharacterized protein YkwD